MNGQKKENGTPEREILNMEWKVIREMKKSSDNKYDKPPFKAGVFRHPIGYVAPSAIPYKNKSKIFRSKCNPSFKWMAKEKALECKSAPNIRTIGMNKTSVTSSSSDLLYANNVPNVVDGLSLSSSDSEINHPNCNEQEEQSNSIPDSTSDNINSTFIFTGEKWKNSFYENKISTDVLNNISSSRTEISECGIEPLIIESQLQLSPITNANDEKLFDMNILEKVFGSYTFPASKDVSSAAGAFRQSLYDVLFRLMEKCAMWNSIIRKDYTSMPEAVHSELSVLKGKINLLSDGKLCQYRSLIDRFDNHHEIPPVQKDDLLGYWDLVYIEIEHIYKQFNYLDMLKNNDWQEIVSSVCITNNSKKVNVGIQQPMKKYNAQSKIQSAIRAAKARFMEQKLSEPKQIENSESEVVISSVQNGNNSYNTEIISPEQHLPKITPLRKSARLLEKQSNAESATKSGLDTILRNLENGLKITPSKMGTIKTKNVSFSVEQPKRSVNNKENYFLTPRRSMRIEQKVISPSPFSTSCILCKQDTESTPRQKKNDGT